MLMFLLRSLDGRYETWDDGICIPGILSWIYFGFCIVGGVIGVGVGRDIGLDGLMRSKIPIHD
jgi:hypothetical protein